MFDHLHYVPILKWRQGEYQALLKLSNAIKDRVTPLFEIPKEKWDFENEVPAKTIDEHLASFGKRLKAKWGNRPCFLDSCHLALDSKMADGRHHLTYLFDIARNEGASPIPVVGISRSSQYIMAAQSIVEVDQRGCCIRLESSDFDLPDLKAALLSVMESLQVGPGQCDLVIDLKADIGTSTSSNALMMQTFLIQLPFLARWRTLTIASGAFPDAPSNQFRPTGKAKRHDWLAYKALTGKLPDTMRIPTFGDYSVSAVNTEELDPRMIDPLAKIKYSIKDEWFITVGTQVKRNGRGQYVGLCSNIVTAPGVFDGAGYSYGDGYIYGCANGTESTGGASTWPTVGSNHHITRVVRDVASLHGSLAVP